jgi:glycosyltransferase involved in cell wall biosynthesis
MHVLWLIRPDLHSSPGGDTTQILETAAALERRGVSVEMSSTRRPDLSRFDLVHLFHLDRVWENVEWCRQIRATATPSVLSPIYWPTDEFDCNGRTGLGAAVTQFGGSIPYQYLKLLHRGVLPFFDRGELRTLRDAGRGYRFARRFLLETVDILLPNSRAERVQLERNFDLHQPIHIVRNAVNPETFVHTHANRQPGVDADADANSVLYVGRIEPRKNQLMLIRALNGSDFRLQIIGRAGRFHNGYERRCRREAGPNVEFLGWRPPQELQKWYCKSGVHVCPSWYETPGLASLEAAYCGCPIVVTSRGSTQEYFGDQAEYCDPSDSGSIRAAIEQALSRPQRRSLQRRIEAEFTWEKAAHETLEAYDLAVKRTPNRDRAVPARGDALDVGEQRAS